LRSAELAQALEPDRLLGLEPGILRELGIGFREPCSRLGIIATRERELGQLLEHEAVDFSRLFVFRQQRAWIASASS
jgi:hypothetical protein